MSLVCFGECLLGVFGMTLGMILGVCEMSLALFWYCFGECLWDVIAVVLGDHPRQPQRHPKDISLNTFHQDTSQTREVIPKTSPKTTARHSQSSKTPPRHHPPKTIAQTSTTALSTKKAQRPHVAKTSPEDLFNVINRDMPRQRCTIYTLDSENCSSACQENKRTTLQSTASARSGHQRLKAPATKSAHKRCACHELPRASIQSTAPATKSAFLALMLHLHGNRKETSHFGRHLQ